ncbi:MAG: hypothetical protein ACTSYD_14015 [Candidatus Heimdallarchaeaceae archaeon]
MSETGYYYYYCIIKVTPNDEEQYEDMGEFDLYLNMTQKELEKKEPKRQPYLDTNYFSKELIEILFKFRASFRDGTEDINRYIDLVKETIENELNVLITEFNVEEIG